MSEYQYYEFLAVERRLSGAAQAELRAISSRARISSTSFLNSYDWGDLKADPLKLLERHFDVFVYLANWDTRRLALRLPRKHFDPGSIAGHDLGDLIDVRSSGSKAGASWDVVELPHRRHQQCGLTERDIAAGAP